MKVAVLGAAGGVGQLLAMLLKCNSNITQLTLFDVVKSTPGVVIDISHINTKTNVQGGNREDDLKNTLIDANIVVIAAGVPPKEKSIEHLFFKANADIVFDCMRAIVTYCPYANIAVVTNPINSIVPVVSKFMSMAKISSKSEKIFGVTTLGLLRASTFVGKANRIDSAEQYVPVIGGNNSSTLIPLLSQSNPPFLSGFPSLIVNMTEKIRKAEDVVLKKKGGVGSATLAAAYAAEQFVNSLIRGINGVCVEQCAYVKSDVTYADFFANPLLLGKNGIEHNMGFGCITSYEQDLLEQALPILQDDIVRGYRYIESRVKDIPVVCR